MDAAKTVEILRTLTDAEQAYILAPLLDPECTGVIPTDPATVEDAIAAMAQAGRLPWVHNRLREYQLLTRAF